MWQIAYDWLDISEDGEIHTVKGELGGKDITLSLWQDYSACLSMIQLKICIKSVFKYTHELRYKAWL